MQPSSTQATFGRRRTVSPAPHAPSKTDAAAVPIPGLGGVSPGAERRAAENAGPDPDLSVSVLRDEDWDQPKKKRKRWLAEPYRTFSIVAGAGFGVSDWVLPDSVDSVVQLVMGGLTVLGLVAGLRKSLLSSTERAVSDQKSRD